MRFLVAIGSVLLVGAKAHAGIQYNGIQMNGIQMNGIQMNGIQMNGIQMNGIQMNGIQMNGIQMNGVAVSGTMLTGTLVDAAPSTCSHSEKDEGAALPSTCNACAQVVCQSDSQCCASAWNSTCVGEAKSMCTVTAQNLVGGTFNANMINPDGTTTPATLQIAAMQLPPYWVQKCVYHAGQQICDEVNEPTLGPNADINLYQVEYQSCYPRYVYPSWQTICSWQPLCANSDGTAYVDRDGLSNMSTIVPGAWETRVASQSHPFTNGVVSWSGGSEIPGTQSTSFTFACRDLGATAKCEERMGYKPWKTVNGVSLDVALQACVRMVRADYCGDGMPHTVDGTAIDVEDSLNVQSFVASDWGTEASWTASGAYDVFYGRYAAQDPTGPAGQTIFDYLQSNCWQVLGGGYWTPNTVYSPMWSADRSSTLAGQPQYL